MKNFKFGFTLAEVLITLAIIGVVAALTIPNLVQNYKERATITKVKKVYAILSNAYNLAINTDTTTPNLISEAKTKDAKGYSEIFAQKLKPYLLISKDCGFESGCFPDKEITYLDGRTTTNSLDRNTNHYRFVLNDGTNIAILIDTPTCINPYITNACGNIKIDIDGNLGNSTYGKDMFHFIIAKDGIIPFGANSSIFGETYSFENACNRTHTSADQNGVACTGWVIENENMDYLRCDDLSWNGKRKCSDK